MNVVAAPQRRKHFRKSKVQLVDELMALERRLAGQNDGRRDEGVGGERPFTLVDNFVFNSPYMFSVKDAEGRYVMVNNQWRETVNATLEEAIGGYPEALLPEELSNQSISHDREARESFKPVIKEETLAIANETRVFQTVKFPLFGEKGEFQGLATIATDITALKTSQEKALQEVESRFRGAIESIPNGVAIFDKNDRFVLCNRAFHRNIEKLALILVPGTSFEEIVRAVAAAGIEPDVREDPEGYIRRRLDMRKRRVPFVQHMAEKDRWIIIHDYEMADGNTFHVRTDITGQKRAEEALREREVELFNARRLNVLGEMAAAVAHEINQPLAVISSYAQGLVEKLRLGNASPDDLLKPVKKIVDQADRAGSIITGIRSLIGRQETHKSSIDLNAAIEEVLVVLQSECEELRINVTTDLDQELPRVLANKIQVQQVVLNLARNAMEAISEGPCASPRLIVCSHRAGDGNVEVAVRDTGPGFSPQEGEAIFEPFHSKKPHGLGLGLSICRSITEAYGGRIWADLASAKGATVRFSLPVAEEKQLENA